MQYKNRKEVPDKYKWDLTSIFKNEDEFNKTFKEVEVLKDKLKNYKGKIKDAKKLYEFLILSK